MEQEVSFETLLDKHRIVVERYINFRLPSSFDADDVIQETYYAAYIGYAKLRSQIPRRKQRGIKFETPQGAGY